MMRVYLDNCRLNRPFDDQSQVRIRLETEAKLFIQRQIRTGKIELGWSYMFDYENTANPFDERRSAVQVWHKYAAIRTGETQEIVAKAQVLVRLGIKSKDALHVACAIVMECDYFITTDDRILARTRALTDIVVMDPTSFIREMNYVD
jgi:hypothetical protein